MNTLEFTFCHNYVITKLELDAVGSHWDDVRILDGSEANEVVHCFILDCQRWIAVGIVLAMDGMIKVVTEKARLSFDTTLLSCSKASTCSADAWMNIKEGRSGMGMIRFLPCFLTSLYRKGT